jgi:hypothetical protein
LTSIVKGRARAQLEPEQGAGRENGHPSEPLLVMLSAVDVGCHRGGSSEESQITASGPVRLPVAGEDEIEGVVGGRGAVQVERVIVVVVSTVCRATV